MGLVSRYNRNFYYLLLCFEYQNPCLKEGTQKQTAVKIRNVLRGRKTIFVLIFLKSKSAPREDIVTSTRRAFLSTCRLPPALLLSLGSGGLILENLNGGHVLLGGLRELSLVALQRFTGALLLV